MSNVKERPISFNDEMVRAVLDGRKTQTRRPIEPQPEHDNGFWCVPGFAANTEYGFKESVLDSSFTCPYGKPGDRLSVPGEPGLTLEITELRAERVQEISEEDALSEGLNPDDVFPPPRYGEEPPAKELFVDLWDSIYGKKYPFDSNPWVWVIGFKKIEVKTA